jgi:hypothetical protein
MAVADWKKTRRRGTETDAGPLLILRALLRRTMEQEHREYIEQLVMGDIWGALGEDEDDEGVEVEEEEEEEEEEKAGERRRPLEWDGVDAVVVTRSNEEVLGRIISRSTLPEFATIWIGSGLL